MIFVVVFLFIQLIFLVMALTWRIVSMELWDFVKKRSVHFVPEIPVLDFNFGLLEYVIKFSVL